MDADTTEIRSTRKNHTVGWLAAGVGAGIGIAALAYSRRRRSPWERARDRANDLIDTAREEYEPWMGMAAGAVAAGTGLAAYLASRKESPWQRVGKRAADVVSRVEDQATNPWLNLAATAAIGLASVAYANNARRRTIRGIDSDAAAKINSLTQTGQRVLRRVRDFSDDAGKRLRHAMA